MAPAKESAFSARLRELREKAGLTQAQLAERAGLHLSAVTRFEHGLREPGLTSAAKLATALGVGVDDLLKPPSSAPSKPQPGRPRKQPAESPAVEAPAAKRARGRKGK
jgi:transcriptional regulator with XRE-family HTH domain